MALPLHFLRSLLLATPFAWTLFVSSQACAATFTVANLNDSGVGSLRQAITDAEESTSTDNIRFAPELKGTLALATSLPDIKSTLVITGPSAREGITIQGNSNQNIWGDLTLSNLTFTGGTSPEGGVFSNMKKLSINGCRFIGNRSTAFNGGAIYNHNGGTLAVTNSVFSGNRAQDEKAKGDSEWGAGGAICNVGESKVIGCTFTDNTALRGGAIYNLGMGKLIVSTSTFSANKSKKGGAIYNDLGDIRIESSTFANNHASEDGGAIYKLHATLDIFNSTFSGNSATRRGGAIFDEFNVVTLESSTLARNRADQEGGALYLGSAPKSANSDLFNSIVAGNSAPIGPNIRGTIARSDYNLIDKPGGAQLKGQHNILGKAPRLGVLTDNGGPTQTFALLATSPAVDRGNSDCTTDQRGKARPTVRPHDIGAFEKMAPIPTRPSSLAQRPPKSPKP